MKKRTRRHEEVVLSLIKIPQNLRLETGLNIPLKTTIYVYHLYLYHATWLHVHLNPVSLQYSRVLVLTTFLLQIM